ncbi:MAG TPA: hypothetical protein VII13_11215 [Vicinamibacteria bacterium]|jgi:hypothetical protein
MNLKSVLRVSLVTLLGLAGQGPRPAPATAAPQTPAPGSPAPAPTAVPGRDPLLEFVPKERVPADSVVSFPVDI